MTDSLADAAPALHRGEPTIHGLEAFEGMRKAGQLAAAALDELVLAARPGVTTQALDDLAREFALDHGATPATLYYRGFQNFVCTSINHVVCHGIPAEKPLKDGDIMNLDITLIVDGWHGDTSRMVVMGEPRRKAERLIDITFESMWKGIEAVKPGATLGDIGHAIQEHAERARCSVVRDFCGHGIGEVFHAPPNVVHYGRPGHGMKLKPGMFFTIEPMINLGKPGVKILEDGWTAVTRDRSLSAQFEHSIGVTEDGFEVFTKSPKGLDKPPYAA